MNIVFVGNYGNGYVGERADEVMLTRDLEELGHHVHRIPRDIWKAHCEGHTNSDWDQYLNIPINIDICIITKWSAFSNGSYITQLREEAKAKVIYWTWDFFDWKTEYNSNDWHRIMCREADLHLTNEGGDMEYMRKIGVTPYYFPFDVSDGQLDRTVEVPKIFDLVFFGSYVGKGDRIKYLTKINKVYPVTIFSVDFERWKEMGFKAYPAIYGQDFAYKVCQSKIILGFSVEPHCWGYWSNRTGKTLTTGGFLLYQYAPGMELFFRDGMEYFSSVEEALDKIGFYNINSDLREKIAEKGYQIGRERYTSKARVKDLLILIERFLKGEILC